MIGKNRSEMNVNIKNLQKFIVVGDRVLIRPLEDANKTGSGLYLPAGVSEKEKIQSGYIIKVGPGYATSTQADDEPWKEKTDAVKYIPLPVSYTHLRAHETVLDLVCRLLLEKKKNTISHHPYT